MNNDVSLAAAERVLALLNAHPRTPTKAEIAAAMGVMYPDVLHESGFSGCKNVSGMDRAAFLAATPLQGLPTIDRSPYGWEAGQVLSWRTGGCSREERREKRGWARERLIEAATTALPRGMRFEIRGRDSDYGRMESWAWYAVDTLQNDPQWQTFAHAEPTYVSELGYRTLGGYVA